MKYTSVVIGRYRLGDASQKQKYEVVLWEREFFSGDDVNVHGSQVGE